MEGHLVAGVSLSLTMATLALVYRQRARSVNAFRWALAIGAGLAVFTIGLLMGLHHCDQGVPLRLAGLFGCLAFIAVGLISPGRLGLLWSVALLLFAISLSYYTANLYHYDPFTGNRQYSSGGYWHSFFTEVYERKIREGGPSAEFAGASPRYGREIHEF